MRTLAHYTLTEPLQVSASYVLHRAYRNADHAEVLVKLLTSEQPSQRDIARLRHEYLITRDIDAPGVVKTYGLESIGHDLALILEDFGGRPLDELLRFGKLDLKAALEIASSLAEAVGAVHDHHLIHKDIKPHTILVNAGTGAVKLADFGIATRLSQETQRAVRPDALEGTLAYMSPEQTGQTNRSLDYRTDLYSLGVTLYQVLAGVLPFPTTDPAELVHSHITRTPPPLRERTEGVPDVVAAIVIKLLAKDAEDRYHSAYGLQADLDECSKRLGETGSIAPFPLGRRDASSALRIVQKLYGREAERDALLAAFNCASDGGAELLLISGYAGVGKSALVSELHQAIVRRGGLFAAGKFDQRARNVPFAAVAAALRELVRHLLMEPAEALAVWKDTILSAVGANGQLLVDLVPDLQLLIGPQPAVPALGPIEAQNRFGLVFQSFIHVFTTRASPLALFLDDLQWADPASLKLLSLLLTDPEGGYLLIIGAYRDHEIGPADPLSRTVADLRKQGAAIREMKLLPLDPASAEQLVADTLGATVAQVRPFARIVFEKTRGNPLYMSQFLRMLHERGRIVFDRDRGAFRFNLARVQAAMVTENVVDFMAGKIQKLAPPTQLALQLAACIGHRFDLKTLAVIHEMTPSETAAALWEALVEGLVVPLDAGYQLAAAWDVGSGCGSADVTYRFLHDRVQQAAYSLIEEPRRKDVHRLIGRLLDAQSDPRERDERLFEIVDHLNIGATRIVDRAERIELARSNLTAGRRAKAAAAYHAAAAYLAAGTALLEEASFRDHYELSFALYTERAECEYLNGQFEEAEALFDLLLSRAQSRLDRARVYTLLVVLYTLRGELAAAIRAGRAALALFGVDLPETEEALLAAFDAELEAMKVNRAGRRIADLIDAPKLTDPERLAHLELLVKLRPASFFSGPAISSVVIAMPVNLCLKYGQSELSEPVYCGIGYTLISLRGMFEEAREFFALSMALTERSAAIRFRCNSDVLLAGHAHFFLHFRKALPLFDRARSAGLQAGDFLFVSFACYHSVMFRLCAGEELGAVQEELARCFALMQRTKNGFTVAILLVARQLIAALMGRTRGRTSLSEGDFDEVAHAEKAKASRFGFAVAYGHFAKLELSLLYGDYPTALAQAALVRETAGNASLFSFATDVPFYEGLALAGLYPSATTPEKERYAAALREHQVTIALWAEHCPENYRHKQILLGAEVARVTGRDAEAVELYGKAIEAAREGHFTHHEALANELTAMYHIGRGRPEDARINLDEAYHGYLRWGAIEKARALEDQRAVLFGVTRDASSRPGAPLSATTTTRDAGLELIDTAAMVRAAQIIASEIVLDPLLDRLMRVMVANAGADRGVLLLARGNRLVVEAIMSVDPDIVRIGSEASLAVGTELAESVVQLVERTKEPVVLGNAAVAGPFRGDAYLAARPPKSLLCLPMAHQGRLAGIVYLESHVVPEAFTRERVELCSLLATHAAIAVENALLVGELRRRTAELDKSNEAISKSNEALAAANEALRTTNERLARELFEREQAEAARVELTEERNRCRPH